MLFPFGNQQEAFGQLPRVVRSVPGYRLYAITTSIFNHKLF